MKLLFTILTIFCTLHNGFATTVAPCKFEVQLIGKDVACFGDFTGEATVNIIPVSGNSGPYEIEWFDGNTNSFRDNLPAGTHFVKVTDALGCFLNEFIDIEQPEALEISLSLTDVFCYEEATGSIDLDVVGGIAPYQFQWSNGESTKDINTLSANIYTVTVTDANQCTIQGSGTINQPAALGISPTVIPISCPGGQDGQLKTVVFGGVLPYRYSWSTSDTIPNIINLSSGNYTLTVTDANNCQIIETYNLPQPMPMQIAFQVTDLSCFSEPDGSVLATVTGGTPGYRYKWSNTDFVLGDTTNNPQGLISDFYKLEVTDAKGCVKIDSAFVDQPTPLIINLETTDATCFDKADGSIDMGVSGGRSPYAILWSTGSTQQDVSQLLSGSYSVVVADVTGCTQYAEIFVGQPDSLDFQAVVNDVTCKDQVDGMISINPKGGTPGYTVNWNTGSTDYELNELPPASYSVALTDANDCPYFGDFTISIIQEACIARVTIPTVFSPNGDGINDTWRIKNYEIYPSMKVEVYDRWGKSVFRSVGYQEAWNGRYKSGNAPSDTYYYIVDLDNGDPPFNGSITIVR